MLFLSVGGVLVNGLQLGRNITILEIYPIVLSLYLWGHVMRDRCILFLLIMNLQSTPLTSSRVRTNTVFKAKHIAGVKNRLADSLSRLQVQYFKQLAPAHMFKLLTEIPLHL